MYLVLSVKTWEGITYPIQIEINEKEYKNIVISKDNVGLLESNFDSCIGQGSILTRPVDCGHHVIIGGVYFSFDEYKPFFAESEKYEYGEWLDELYKPTER